MPEKVVRRLAAILAVDMVSYSRLIGEDETDTISRLKAHQIEIINPKVADHGGRIVKTMGDGLLAEFGSAVEAVLCAVEVQRAINGSEAAEPESRRIAYRMGINLGEIVLDGDDILGDGVNIAARLESLAEPGGICLSDAVFKNVRGRIDLTFSDSGQHEVKNVSEPVQTYRVVLDPAETGPDTAARRRLPWRALAASTLIALLAGAIAVWQPWSSVGVDSRRETAKPLAGKPSVAVLPFENLSGDPKQEYFAVGITQEIITNLSKISALFVIARRSVMKYKGKSVDVRKVASDLGVRYVVSGSVRRAGDTVRISAELIDAHTRVQMWAERYDGKLTSVFSFQDRVTGHIIGALKLKLTPSEVRAVESRGTANPAAYDAYLRGLRLLSARRRLNLSENAKARSMFSEAIRLDPNFASAYAGLAWARWLRRSFAANYFGEFSLKRIFDMAERSIRLGDNALARRLMSKKHFSLYTFAFHTTGKVRLALVELEAARRLQPSDPDVLADLATAYSFGGHPDKALSLIRRAMELNPSHPSWYFGASGIALMLTGEPRRAAEHLRKWSKAYPSWDRPYLFLAAALANAGKQKAAKQALSRFDQLYARGSTKTLMLVRRHWPMAPAQQKIFHNGLKLAGMKERIR